MTTEKLLNVGDVIISSKFAYGYYQDIDNKDLITVDGVTTERLIPSSVREEERVVVAAQTGKIPSKTRTIEYGAYDLNRATAKFVIERANMQGGSTGHDAYSDGWHVEARRLNEDGSYNPDEEVIHFYMSGSFTYLIESEDIEIVGKMERQLRFV